MKEVPLAVRVLVMLHFTELGKTGAQTYWIAQVKPQQSGKLYMSNSNTTNLLHAYNGNAYTRQQIPVMLSES